VLVLVKEVRVIVTFNDEEVNALLKLIDIATKTEGLQVAEVSVHFLNKFREIKAEEKEKSKEKTKDSK
jgi:acylphosphatase